MFKGIREPDNFYTHAIPALACIPFTMYLVAALSGSLAITAALLYGLSMFLLFTASSLYHSIPKTDRELFFWKKIDHSFIFVMIAGCYTPTLLLIFDGKTQIALFSYMWSIAMIGIAIKLSGKLTQGWVSLAFYLAMGWTIVVVMKDLIEKLSTPALFWLFVGGFFYSAGAYFYNLDKRKAFLPKFSYHAVWHLFVVAGALAHVVFNGHYIFKIF